MESSFIVNDDDDDNDYDDDDDDDSDDSKWRALTDMESSVRPLSSLAASTAGSIDWRKLWW